METITLTKQQERCVDYDGGDLLVRGVAGSGKSYVILSRAKKAYEKYPSAKIRIFTYQNTLVTYTQSLLKLKLQEDAVAVSTIDSYCRDLFLKMSKRSMRTRITAINEKLVKKVLDKHEKKSRVSHRLYNQDTAFWVDEFNWIRGKCIKTKTEYMVAERTGRGSQVRVTRVDRGLIWDVYLILLEEMEKADMVDWNEIYIYLTDNAAKIPKDKKIDYVFVDEAQDMTLGKMKTLKLLTKKSITIAADMAQKIYKSSFTWKEVGIDVSGGGSKSLSKSFRSTKQIVLLAEDLMKENRENAKDSGEYTEAVLPEVEGVLPRLCKFKNADAQNEYIKELLNTIDIETKRVAIIVYSDSAVSILKNKLFQLGVRYQHIDSHKRDWDILTPGVKIVKAFSSKGLEFDYVIIPYLTDTTYPFMPNMVDKDAMEEYLRQQRSVLYVAMTRARIGLIMLTIRGSESRFIDSFDPAHYEVEII